MSAREPEVDASHERNGAWNSQVTLAELARVPLGALAAAIQDDGVEQLELTVDRLRRDTTAVPERFGADRVAWCLAWHAAGGDGPAVAGAKPARDCGYQAKWPPETPWSVVWEELCAVRGGPDQGRRGSWLGELALSVFCECRDDWQPPQVRPLVPSESERAFEYVHRQNHPRVLAALRRASAGSEDADTFANEAWARVYCDYWSVRARSRFGGLSSLATFVAQVARYVAIDTYRARAREGSRAVVPDEGDDARPLESMLQELGVIGDTSRRVTSQEWLTHVRRGVADLPPRRRLVASMVWFRGLSAAEAARLLGISPAAVSQHLTAARARLAEHLGEQGLAAPAPSHVPAGPEA